MVSSNGVCQYLHRVQQKSIRWSRGIYLRIYRLKQERHLSTSSPLCSPATRFPRQHHTMNIYSTAHSCKRAMISSADVPNHETRNTGARNGFKHYVTNISPLNETGATQVVLVRLMRDVRIEAGNKASGARQSMSEKTEKEGGGGVLTFFHPFHSFISLTLSR